MCVLRPSLVPRPFSYAHAREGTRLASARTELKRQRFLDIGVTDLCGKMVLEFGKLCRLCLSVYIMRA